MSPFRMYLFVSILFFFTLSLSTTINVPEAAAIAKAEQGIVLDTDNLELLKSYLSPAQSEKVDGILARTDGMSRIVLIETANTLAERPEEEEEIGELPRFFLGQFVDALDNPEVALQSLMDNLPVALFLLLPVYAVLLQLFYWRSGRYYVEHLVFGVYLHTVAFLLFTLLMLLPDSERGFFSVLESVLQLSYFVYYFLALKKYYGQSGLMTTLKFGSMLCIYTIMLIPGLAMVMAATFVLL